MAVGTVADTTWPQLRANSTASWGRPGAKRNRTPFMGGLTVSDLPDQIQSRLEGLLTRFPIHRADLSAVLANELGGL